jgi:hypothetical protein
VRHVGLHGADGVGREVLTPQAVGDALGRDDLPARQEQHGEDSALPATAEVHLDVALARAEPAQDADPEPAASRHPTSGNDGKGRFPR